MKKQPLLIAGIAILGLALITPNLHASPRGKSGAITMFQKKMEKEKAEKRRSGQVVSVRSPQKFPAKPYHSGKHGGAPSRNTHSTGGNR